MASPRRSETVASSSFPIYSIKAMGDDYFVIVGGGGSAKTGVINAFVVYEMGLESGKCVLKEVLTHQTNSIAPMNLAILKNSKNYILALGMDDTCQLYKVAYSMKKKPQLDKEVSEGLRQRHVGDSSKDDETNSKEKFYFDVEELNGVKSDFSKRDAYQKCVKFNHNGTRIVTGGADGHVRIWQHPDMKKLHEIKAHTNEVDDIDVHPAGTHVASVSRDNKGCIWQMKDGHRFIDLVWNYKADTKYRIRNCRYGRIIDQKDKYRLYTTHIPAVMSSKSQCYITSWETETYKIKKVVSTGYEIISSLAVSEDGTFLAVGTISGSVSVYISFSLQRLYHVSTAHKTFVTGLEFTPASTISSLFDFTLLSISADNQIKMHQVNSRTLWNPLWAVAGFIVLVYMAFWLISYLGL